MSSSEDDLDELQLSVEAQRALTEFYEEQNEKLLTQYDDKKDMINVHFDEDWVSRQILNMYFFVRNVKV